MIKNYLLSFYNIGFSFIKWECYLQNESSSKLKAIQSYGRDAGYLIIGTTVTKSIISNQYTKIKENKQELSISKETTRASQLQSSKITSAVLKSSLTDTPEFKDNNVRARRNHLSIEDTSNSEKSPPTNLKKETARTRRVCIITQRLGQWPTI